MISGTSKSDKGGRIPNVTEQQNPESMLYLKTNEMHTLSTYIHPLVSSGSSDTFKSEEEGEIVPNLNEGVTEQQNPAYVPLEECRILRAPEGSSQSPQYVNDNM